MHGKMVLVIQKLHMHLHHLSPRPSASSYLHLNSQLYGRILQDLTLQLRIGLIQAKAIASLNNMWNLKRKNEKLSNSKHIAFMIQQCQTN